MTMNSRPVRERVVIGIGAVVIIAALWLSLAPTSGNRNQLPAAEARRQTRRTATELDQIRAETDRMTPALKGMVYDGAAEKVMPQVVNDVQALASRSGLHLRELKPLRQKKQGDIARQTLTVRFSSDFGQTIPFLYKLEDPTGKLVIDKLNVASADPKSRSVDVEVQLAFFTRETQKIGGRDERQ
ncbi:MAG: type 4a pilus biogenesis protein PilO [Armatimonadetes bacterium]|nr:type 4a pilus biogenesis protein PilO [Armatimonadota bacterium]